MNNRILRIIFLATLSWHLSAAARCAEPEKSAAREFISQFGDDWMNHFAAEYESAYPFGRSNQKHDAEIAQALTLSQATENLTLTNKRYLFDGDWYAVQWIYGATSTKTRKRQTESTVAFGRVKDGKLVVWEEYFDDLVGELQADGKLPLYQADEEPYPWPAGATIKHPYRP